MFISDVYEKMAEGTRSLDPFAALYLTANFVKVNNRKPFFFFWAHRGHQITRGIRISAGNPQPQQHSRSVPLKKVIAHPVVWDGGCSEEVLKD